MADVARLAAIYRSLGVQLQARIDFVGFGAEIVCHRDQVCGDLLILYGRRYPKALSGLPTQVCGTGHTEFPRANSRQRLKVCQVPD
jgi:hypothetical protein